MNNRFDHQNFIWKEEIADWIGRSHFLKPFAMDLEMFFEQAFNHAMIPSKAYFGHNKTAISLMVGRLFLASYVRSGDDTGIWLLVENNIEDFIYKKQFAGVYCKMVLSTKNAHKQLYWIWIPAIENLSQILGNDVVWSSFRRASGLAEELSTHGRRAVERQVKGKIRLDSFWEKGNYFPEEIIGVVEPGQYIEGALKQITVNAYERDKDARDECIEHYGSYACQICGFDFAQKYGELGKSFIHVHHIKPLSQVGSEYKVNPSIDLIPVCPNCHAMLHRNKGSEVTVEALRALLRR